MGLLGWKFGRMHFPESVGPALQPVIPALPYIPNVPQIAAPEHEAAKEGQIIYKGKVLRDPKAYMLGALSGQRALRFANRGAMERFLERAQGRFPIMERQDGMLSLRIRAEDPASLDELLDGGEEQGFVFPVIPPNPRGGEVQSSAVPIGEGLLEWLGVRKVDASWGAGVKVAVLDTGVTQHTTFKAEVKNVMIVESAVAPQAWNGHGTAVASLITGSLPEAQGVAPGAELTSYRVADDKGRSDTWTMAVAIRRAVDDGNQIISISMGSYGDSPLVREAVGYAIGKGVVLVASSGNDSYEKPTYPAAYPGVVKAVAVDASGEHLLFSNSADESAISAPGWAVNAAYPEEKLVEFSGTSASAPIIAGAVAAVMTKAGKDGARLSAQEALELVFAYTNELGAAGPDAQTGAGGLSLGRILRRDTPGIEDAAVASQVIYPASGNEFGSVEVNVQNQGTSTLANVPFSVTTPTGVSQFSVNTLAPGAVHTVRVPLPAPLFLTGMEVGVFSQITRPDMDAGNNVRRTVFTPPTAKQ
jgi:hypothetical protein